MIVVAGKVTRNILLVAGLLTLVLFGMIWERVDLLRSGRAIVLDVVPVDPRSLFRGDYVILRYPISRIDLGTVEGDKVFSKHDKIYVGLKQNEDATWQAFSVHADKPPVVGAVAYLKGRVTSAICPAGGSDCSQVRVKYGLESYFVPEGKGKQLEQMIADRRLQVAARVSDDGDAAIEALAVDGTRFYGAPLF